MAFQNHSECLSTFQKFKGGVMDINKEREAYLKMLVGNDAISNDQADALKLMSGDSHFYTYGNQVSVAKLDLINWGWNSWVEAKSQAIPEQTLKSDCMINKLWFMKGTPVANLIQHAEEVYKAEVIAQNSKIKFGTDDNEIWWAHDVPYYGEVQMDWIKEDQEWDIFFNGCWQGPFNTKEECIKHLEECIAEQRAEAQELSHD